MKEIPILFSTAMVQAILEGRKSQTRRLVKPQPEGETLRIFEHHYDIVGDGGEIAMLTAGDQHWENPNVKFPYGNIPFTNPVGEHFPGDVLWVRESWNRLTYSQGDISFYGYKADPNHPKERKWKPSIHMPKVAARIWLQVESVRVERLQDISQDDIIAEGVCYGEEFMSELCKWRDSVYGIEQTRKKYWQKTWEKINGAESWQANPWVWVVSFKVLSTTGRPAEKPPITNI